MLERNLSHLDGINQMQLQHTIDKGEIRQADDDPVPWDMGWFEAFARWSSLQPARRIFLFFSDTPHLLAKKFENSVPIFSIALEPIIESGIYIVSQNAAGTGWRISAPESSYVELCAQVMASPYLKDISAVLLGQQLDKFTCYKNGVSEDNSGAFIVSLATRDTQVDWLAIKESLDMFAAEHLNSEDLYREIWARKEKHWPVKDAEKKLQFYLLIRLRGEYRKSHEILPEPNVASGRIDLLFMAKTSAVQTNGLLELKVLRSYSYNGETDYGLTQWKSCLHGGGAQAKQYAHDASVGFSGLCTFDMRKDRDLATCCTEEIEAFCAQHGVGFVMYTVYNSLDKFRRKQFYEK